MIIDTDNYAASGIEPIWFNGGEAHANVPDIPDAESMEVTVHAKIRSAHDMMMLIAVCDALTSQQIEVHLFMPYLPGARQDRNPGSNTPLTSQITGTILSDFVHDVTVVDVHSGLALDNFTHGLNMLYDRSYVPTNNIDPIMFLKDLITVDGPDFVLQVDKGAEDRAYATAKLFNCNVVTCSKSREFGTGKLGPAEVPTLMPGRYLIADDICDGGRTFTNLLTEIRKQLPARTSPVDLYVTHGIFSQGLEALIPDMRGNRQGFDRIFTTDSWFNPRYSFRDSDRSIIDSDRFYVHPLAQLIK